MTGSTVKIIEISTLFVGLVLAGGYEYGHN